MIMNTCTLVYTPWCQHYDLQAQYSTLTWLLTTYHMQHPVTHAAGCKRSKYRRPLWKVPLCVLVVFHMQVTIMTVRRLDFVHRLSYFDFVMYYIYGQSGPSLLIDSMICTVYTTSTYIIIYNVCGVYILYTCNIIIDIITVQARYYKTKVYTACSCILTWLKVIIAAAVYFIIVKINIIIHGSGSQKFDKKVFGTTFNITIPSNYITRYTSTN